MELRISTTRLLALGIDERVFEEDSLLRKNALQYGKRFLSAHILCRSGAPRSAEHIGNTVFHPVFVRAPFLFPLFAFFAGLRIIREDRGAWIISSDNPFEIGLVSWMLARLARGKLFLQIHTDVLSPQFRRASWKERVRFWCAKFVIPRAGYLRAVSERIRRSLVESGLAESHSIAVLPVATDIERFSSAVRDASCDEFLNQYSFRMIAVGRLVDKEKNFSMLIGAMKEFVKIFPAAFLAIVGHGPDRNRYDALIRQNRLENNVMIGDEHEMEFRVCRGVRDPMHAREAAKDDFLPSFYKSFDLCVISSNYEGWNRVAVEAMAAGLPVLMTDVGLAGEVVRSGENGVVVPVGDMRRLLEEFIRLIRNREDLSGFARGAERTIRSFPKKSRESYMKEYENLLLALIQK